MGDFLGRNTVTSFLCSLLFILLLAFFVWTILHFHKYIIIYIFYFQRYQQAPGAAPSSRGAPPPYPGAPTGGPSHGYGEGRGHYNRSRGGLVDPRSGGHGHGGDRKSWAPPHSHSGGGQR